uniref:Uncharacterized protein n=1 Tax=Chromera velia CCMP2878 TaxID=1169474 RepID=A0A0G4IAR2_9ALVE|mmetsp:Transcript_53083/g.103872  ORF Transcript_53083/g.103872 Transcript_53083/m.103872 type:complete len:490 (+) Transcript_53083:211-1680(+)|eukprot:Cvel_12526.t1-p1 / transcript=Cvel_12526.t1 / gene=Cvel_12526 / organism=Chromera_velia_CCMP2878 / gene_product=Pleiotropic regulator 1, putative / transcript_product=Pleiotropic regulator 1, putative / location=Cvel_scaffold822:40403-44964(-) / protein_length=489 / sequence_SO=supercontig / SO=protein_coding / is_pseudo=false
MSERHTGGGDLVEDVQPQSLNFLWKQVAKRTHDMFAGNHNIKPKDDLEILEKKIRFKWNDEIKHVPNREELLRKAKPATSLIGRIVDKIEDEDRATSGSQPTAKDSLSLSIYQPGQLMKPADSTSAAMQQDSRTAASASASASSSNLGQLAIRAAPHIPRPTWHPPWKLMRVISGHTGWVRCVAVDPNNEFFVSGGNDRLIKIWDLASGTLRLTLTGHINSVRGLALSTRSPYLFSCGEDNTVKCWDLEQNKVIRSYHGHLSGVYSLALHPALDVLFSGGRDSVVRVWDIRTKTQIHCLSGHSGTIMALESQSAEPQLISGAMDNTIRLWDLIGGKSRATLTHHKKSVRALSIHPTQYTFCSAAADHIKVWRCPNGNFERNVPGGGAIPNCTAIKNYGDSSILVVGADNGFLNFYDYKSGYRFQSTQSQVQPGSMEAENAIFACAFDQSQTRLITGECDKTIKIWKEDDEATEDTHPVTWRPPKDPRKM